ncbi:hypothetical protein DXA14_22170 [Hungatella hathewayi]|nr:hypothetical protein DXA14_22170 [Hungatella hathewayi]
MYFTISGGERQQNAAEKAGFRNRKKAVVSGLTSYVKRLNVYSIFVENRLTFCPGLCIIKKHSYPRSVGRYDSCGHRILFMAIAPIFRHDSQV